jgi:hypothetical protein
MSWDTVYSWSQIFVVAFAGLALVSGLVVNKRQSKQMLELETDLSKQREKTAVAEKSLLELQQLVKEPRTVDQKRADEILDWGEKGSVTISFNMLGDEPVNLAKQLAEVLHAHGWRILKVEQALIPTKKGIVIYQHGDAEETVITNWSDAPEPAKTLHRLSAEAVVGNSAVETHIRSVMPKDSVELQVAAKY